VSARRDELRRFLAFGGQISPVVGVLIALVIVFTALPGLDRGLRPWLELAVWPGSATELMQPWRLLTWALVQPLDILYLLILGAAIFSTGRLLQMAWSDTTFVVHLALITVGAGVLSELLWFVLGGGYAHVGLWPVVNGLLLAWALQFPRREVQVFMVGAHLTGAAMARWIALGTPVAALALGTRSNLVLRLVEFAPHHFALLVAWLLVTGGPRRVLHRLVAWWQERSLARARRKFKFIDGGKPPRSYLN
jgi:hypothetical protein